MSARPSKKSAAARARKQRQRYLSDVVVAGELVGFRFNPGPHLRQAGAVSSLLKRADGSWMSETEARAFRDAAIKRAQSGAAAPVVAPTPVVRRTLDALWKEFEAHHDKLAADGDDDAIAPKTRAFYRSMIKPWLAWGGDELVAALDAETIEIEYKAQKKAGTHSKAHASLRALMAVLARGVKLRWIATNPALDLGMSRPRGRLRLGTPAEIAALVEAADAAGEKEIGDAIVHGVWTAQRLDDLLTCDLDRQLQDGFLTFARTHEADDAQAKTGGQAQVLLLEPSLLRIGARTTGPLIPPPKSRRPQARETDLGAWTVKTFNTRFIEIRKIAAEKVPSVADLQFRDLRDTAVTRLHLAGRTLAEIALWSGHSMKSIQEILAKHYLVATREGAKQAGEAFDAWRLRSGMKW